MLCMKVSVLKEEPPRLFISLLVMRRTRGVVKPSPTAPINPNPISNQSTLSACMNIDLTLPKLFILFLPLSFSSSLTICICFNEREKDRETKTTPWPYLNDRSLFPSLSFSKRYSFRATIFKAETFFSPFGGFLCYVLCDVFVVCFVHISSIKCGSRRLFIEREREYINFWYNKK